MKIINKTNLCENRPYINLKKLSWNTPVRVGKIDETGFKTTYIINQDTQDLFRGNNYTCICDKGIEKFVYQTEDLNGKLLVEINYSSKGGASSAKFKVYAILDSIKYALPFSSFEDTYRGCMAILHEELLKSNELPFVKIAFENIKKEEASVDLNLNLKRLAEFRDKVNYKRNVDYFVINNIASATSKYDIKNKCSKIQCDDNTYVLRYEPMTRLYNMEHPSSNNPIINLKPTDIICSMGKDGHHPVVSIYMPYGLGKLLDIENNVIPSSNMISLFANILDLGLDVLK